MPKNDHNDDVTIWSKRIKRKNKRLLTELIQAMIIIVAMCLFFGAAWLIDTWINPPQ